MTQSTLPFLWFDGQAEEAARFYVKLFPRSKLIAVHRMPGPGPAKARPVLTVEFVVDGLRIVALNGGPQYKGTPAMSFAFQCKNQREIDKLWAGLTSGGGAESMCGWCVDRYGYSWQVVPENMPALLGIPGAIERMLKMRKLDIAGLRGTASKKASSKKAASKKAAPKKASKKKASKK